MFLLKLYLFFMSIYYLYHIHQFIKYKTNLCMYLFHDYKVVSSARGFLTSIDTFKCKKCNNVFCEGSGHPF